MRNFLYLCIRYEPERRSAFNFHLIYKRAKMKRHHFVLVAALVLLMGACRPDEDYISALDQELDEVLQTASNGVVRFFFRLTLSAIQL